MVECSSRSIHTIYVMNANVLKKEHFTLVAIDLVSNTMSSHHTFLCKILHLTTNGTHKRTRERETITTLKENITMHELPACEYIVLSVL